MREKKEERERMAGLVFGRDTRTHSRIEREWTKESGSRCCSISLGMEETLSIIIPPGDLRVDDSEGEEERESSRASSHCRSAH